MRKMLYRFFLFLLIFASYYQSYAKVMIIVPVYNRPDFIELQYKTFTKFLQDDFELVMFNDANNPDMYHAIHDVCNRYNIRCIDVPQQLHDVDPNCHHSPPAFRHGEVMQFAFGNYGFNHDDIVMLIDSDVFLIRYFSIRKHLEGYDLCGVFQGALVPQCCAFNMPKLPNPDTLNFRASFTTQNGYLDPGIMTHLYIRDNLDLKVKNLNVTFGITKNYIDKNSDIHKQLLEKGYIDCEIKLIETIINLCTKAEQTASSSAASKLCFDIDIGFYEHGNFLDYKHGSGWHGPRHENLIIKDTLIKNFIESIL